MKKVVVIISLASTCLIFLSCKKDSTSASDNILILKDNFDFFNNGINKGVDNTFTYNGEFDYAFGFYCNNNSTSIDLNIFSSIAGTEYDLRLIKSDPGIIIGKNYTSIFEANSLSSTFQATDPMSNGPSITGTKVEIIFSKFQYPGRIEGTFVTYINSSVWCTGSFKFTAN